MRIREMLAKSGLTFLSVWLVSSVAMSNGSSAPELPILNQARSSSEYPVLKRIQELTLDLQLLEITIKNRRDAQTEEKLSVALKEIEAQGAALSAKFKSIRASQLDGLYALLATGRRFGRAMGIAEPEWDELFTAVKENAITAGTLSVHGRSGALNLVNITPLYTGKQLVWNISLPAFDRKSFWVQARSRAHKLGGLNSALISNKALEARALELNSSFADAEKSSKEYFTSSYAKLYGAFQTQRYAILQRIEMARKALIELEKHNGSMGTPEEYSTLYNQVLDNLFSYGIDVSLTGAQQRDFAIKGFLFAESPERSQQLLKKLKHIPSGASYNPPST